MKCARFSTLPVRFVEKERRLHRILYHFPFFYVEGAAHAPVLPKLCGGMVFPQAAVRYNKDVPERQKVGAEKFGGVFDNTEIFHKLADLTKVR